MQLLSILLAALAATSVSAAKLKCTQKQQPYCCDSIAKVGQLTTSVGITCSPAKRAAKTQCKTSQDKVCCDKSHGEPSQIGDLKFCHLPLDLQEILEKAGLGGLLGGGGGKLPIGGGGLPI